MGQAPGAGVVSRPELVQMWPEHLARWTTGWRLRDMQLSCPRVTVSRRPGRGLEVPDLGQQRPTLPENR